VDLGRGLAAFTASGRGQRPGAYVGFPRFQRKTASAQSFRIRCTTAIWPVRSPTPSGPNWPASSPTSSTGAADRSSPSTAGTRRARPAPAATPPQPRCRCRPAPSIAHDADTRPTGTATPRSTSPSGPSSTTPRSGTPTHEARSPTLPEEPATTRTHARAPTDPTGARTPPPHGDRGRPRRAVFSQAPYPGGLMKHAVGSQGRTVGANPPPGRTRLRHRSRPSRRPRSRRAEPQPALQRGQVRDAEAGASALPTSPAPPHSPG
jgi:hypothetical protein